nr:Na+/H+ antiporter NhaC family protein [Lachnoclostridium sp. An118]
MPIVVFLVIFLGSGIVTGDFYSMPTIVAFLIALCVAFLQNRKVSFDEKMHIIAQGVGDDNIITMSLIFLCAGGFSGAVTAAGGVESTVNLGLSILPPSVAVAGLFVIGCFISVSMGTSMGTIAALAPIAVGISEKTGFSMAICIGAVVCGAMFGDNLSMISDTTIAAVKTQGCEMKDKFRENFLIVLPAAILTVIIFLLITRGGGTAQLGDLTFNIWRVVPYVLVLVGALIGINVYVVLIGGTILSVAVGIATGSLAWDQIFLAIGGNTTINGQEISGVMGMYDITVISIIVACIVSLVKEYGGIHFILQWIHRRIKGEKGAELGIAGLALLVDACTANNTVAIVMAGPIAKEISEEYGVSPRRSASLLDIFTSVGQGLIPYGAQLLSAASLTALTPYDIIPYLYYPILMAVSAVLFILLRSRKEA